MDTSRQGEENNHDFQNRGHQVCMGPFDGPNIMTNFPKGQKRNYLQETMQNPVVIIFLFTFFELYTCNPEVQYSQQNSKMGINWEND